jgi:PilZ domain
MNKRRNDRVKAVLPVKVWGNDNVGAPYTAVAHTLDITQTGARLGSVRRTFNVGDRLTLQYRQRKADFRVIWTRQLQGSKEYQIGLETVTHENDPWGLKPESRVRDVPQPGSLAPASA